MVIEGRETHERHLEILKDLQQELVRQRPSPGANMGMELRSIAQSTQADVRGRRSSLAIPNISRTKSEDLLDDAREEFLCADTPRPRSRSSNDAVYIEEFSEVIGQAPATSQGALSICQRAVPRLDVTESLSRSQAAETLSQEEPTVSFQVSQRENSQCRRPCSCQCHRSSKLKTPDFLRQITGQLLVGYAGISNFTLPCNEHACAQRQKASVRIQYSFPVWSLIQRILTVVSYSGGARGPEKLLRMSRIRPGLDEVFIQVQSGNVGRLRQLFVKGDASPLDASDTGWTLLHYALTAGQFSTAKFLKDAGADIHAESARRETPFDVSWNRILSGSLDAESELLLRNVFSDDDQLDNRQFTPLHKIVLGMLSRSLAAELEVSTAHIDARDSSGYTPLSWAASRGDYRSVEMLLSYGASLSIANDVGEEPIHLAAQTGNVETLKALVQAGASVNKEVCQTQMTPIHFAAEYQDSSEQIYGLARLGALVDGEDYLSWTPLHWAAWRGHLASLNALLGLGASVLAKTADGNAPIMLAVASNSNECVQQLVDAGADCSIVRDSQWNLLHYVAIGGSSDTLRALLKADLSGVDLQGLKTKDTGQTVTDMLNARLEALSFDENQSEEREAWKTAWDRITSACSAREMTDDNSTTFGPPARSDTDSIYLDADDQPFDLRN